MPVERGADREAGSGKALARLAGGRVELEAPRPHGSAAGRTVMTAVLFNGDAQEAFVEFVCQNLQHGEGCGTRAVRVEDHTADADRPLRRSGGLAYPSRLRLHVALRELIAGGAAPPFGASQATKLLRNIHPQGAAGLGT